MNLSPNDPSSPAASDDVNVTEGYPSVNATSYSTTTGIEDPQGQNVVASFFRTEVSAGPLPHPELLKGYDQIIKDGAERIMRMAEKEQDNRFEERSETRRQIWRYQEINLR